MLDINLLEYKDEEIARVRFYPNGTCDELTVILQSRGEWKKLSLEVTPPGASGERAMNPRHAARPVGICDAAAGHPTPARGRRAKLPRVQPDRVMIAMFLFFMAVFTILALVSNTLRNARALQQPPIDAGMAAAIYVNTNRFFRGEGIRRF